MNLDFLPPRQKDVVHSIRLLTEQCGYPPTLAELAKELGLRNRMTVHQHVVALKKKGVVHWEPGLNRSLRVTCDDKSPKATVPNRKVTQLKSSKVISIDLQRNNQSKHSPGIPLVGTIAAGQPIDAVEQKEYLSVESRFSDNNCFALKVKGDSMIEDGIYDGDFVIVKPKLNPLNGEIVVALLEDGSATLKRFFKEKNGFRLQPANAAMEPIYVPSAHQLEIQGIVVGLFRNIS